MYFFFLCQVAEETWLRSNFSHFVSFFQSLVTPQAILKRMFGWLAFDSSRFAYILWCIWNSINNMIFQNTPPVLLKIVIQAIGSLDENLRVYQLKENNPDSSVSSSGALADSSIYQNSFLYKGKGVLDPHKEAIVLAGSPMHAV